MRAGTLRDYVTIQSLTTSQDTYGGVTEAWEDFASVWAEVHYLSGNELWRAQQTNAEVRGRVRIRYRSDIKPTMRVKYGSVYLDILAILPADNKGQELELLFKEWVD